MTKQDLYLALCQEAGTYDEPDLSADEWYDLCGHNIHQGLDEDLQRAADGDVRALFDARNACGLPPLV